MGASTVGGYLNGVLLMFQIFLNHQGSLSSGVSKITLWSGPHSVNADTLIGVYPGNGEGGKGVGAGCERSEQRCERSEQQLVTPVTNQARALLLHEGEAESAREWLGTP